MNPRSRETASPSASPALRELFATQLSSYEQLELALALRDRPDGALVELARELQITQDVLYRVAAELAEQGLVELLHGGTLRLTSSRVQHELLAEASAPSTLNKLVVIREPR